MSMTISLWTLLLFLLTFVSRGNAGECQKPDLEGHLVLTNAAILKNNFPDGSEVTLKCAAGYVRDQGSDTITCISGQWSQQELTCKKKDCGLPILSPNMKYDIPNGTLFSAFITPICDRGYRLRGSSHRQCLVFGWTGNPKCLLITCGKLPKVPNSIIDTNPDKEILEFDDVIKYSCKDKYTLVGNRSVVCQQDGKYSSLPQCKAVTCGQFPEISHSVIINRPAKDILEFEDIIEYSCEDKYILVGNGFVVCQENGTYSSLPQCKEITCGKIPEVPHAIINNRLAKESLEFKNVIEYSCEDKYTLVGNGSVFCQENGTYSSLPQCKEGVVEKRDVSLHWSYIAIVITVLIIICIITWFLVQCFQKQKGSYDTGEEMRTKEALMQENSLSYIQYQWKDP